METNVKLEPIQIDVTPELSVRGSVGIPEWWPSGHRVGVVLAHDAGGGLDDELLTWLHVGLTRLGMLTLRFGFPYAAQGRKRPDPPALLERTFRAAASALLTEPQAAPARVFLGGIGLGAQVAARVLAQGHVADGLLCLAYPLHPSGKPNQARAEALYRIICPMLFVQGSRDPYCRIDRLEAVLRRVGAPTVLHAVEDADHGLAPIKRSQRELDEVRAEILSTVESFVRKALGG